MSRKSKGINAERELIHLFWNNNWAAVRVAGSGSMRYPCPDIVAGNSVRRVAVECKATKSKYKYLGKDEIEDLKTFCKIFGTEPWIGVKFNKENWFFMNIEDLVETKGSYLVSVDIAKSKGLLFEELIK